MKDKLREGESSGLGSCSEGLGRKEKRKRVDNLKKNKKNKSLNRKKKKNPEAIPLGLSTLWLGRLVQKRKSTRGPMNGWFVSTPKNPSWSESSPNSRSYFSGSLSGLPGVLAHLHDGGLGELRHLSKIPLGQQMGGRMTDGYYGVAVFIPSPTMHMALWVHN